MSLEPDKIRALVGALMAPDPEAGAALCILQGGTLLLDQRWGYADAAQGRPYTADSLQITMSMAKGVMGLLLAVLIERGQLEAEAPVARYWPEFAAAGKGAITVAQLFSHQAGLPLLDGGLSLALAADREALAHALAAQAPQWAPGTAHGYHAVTLGAYADALIERASGRTLAALLAELTARMGVEIHCGLPALLSARAVRILPGPPRQPGPPPDPAGLPFRVLTNTPELVADPQEFINGPRSRAVSLPGTNMYSEARSLARLYAGLLAGGVWNGERLCSPEAIAEATRERVRGTDLVNGAEMAYGLAFQRPSGFAPFSPHASAYGHLGAGGSIAFADPETGLALAWSPSRFSAVPYDGRMKALLDAVYEGLR